MDLLKAGVCNLQRHVSNAKSYGVGVVVAINRFLGDTDAEFDVVKAAALEAGADAAVIAEHWAKGGEGARELGEEVIKACEKTRSQESSTFKFLYDVNLPIKEKIEAIAKTYGAAGVEYTDTANEQIERYTSQGFGNLPICMAKTHLSFSADANMKGAPTGFTIPIREVRASVGAGFLYPLVGTMSTMPGLPTRPCIYDVDIDFDTGKVVGLF